MAEIPPYHSKKAPVIKDPVDPPKAEKTTKILVILLCWEEDKDVKIVEVSVGYKGAKKRPLKGIIQAESGISEQQY